MDLSLGIVRDPEYLEHKTGLGHPEDPGRLTSLHQMLDQEFSGRFLSLAPTPASLEQIELVHSPAYVQLVLSTARRAFTNLTSDTPSSAHSCQAAWLAVGGCLKALEALLTGQCAMCLALVRPPGHHTARYCPRWWRAMTPSSSWWPPALMPTRTTPWATPSSARWPSPA
ncbi:MAG: hypothetical protein HY794_19230 [Desulfarculus sp.]|nr:hypothetical protein [Desulfarculus sp.]